MEAPVAKSEVQSPRLDTPTPTQDEEMKVPLAALTLNRNEYCSDYVDDSFHDKKGMVIQFLNGSCPGAASVIGGIRTNLEDIRKAPLYLHQNRALIKQHAAKALLDHWKDLNYGMGCTEHITIEDFGMAFTVASVSCHGAKLNPLQRTEGPLFYCHFPALVDPQVIVHTDWSSRTDGIAIHIINAYVTLLPPHQRRNALIRKDIEDRAEKAAASSRAQAATPVILQQTGGAAPKKPRPNPPSNAPSASGYNNNTRQAPYPTRPLHDTATLREEMSVLHALINRVQSQLVPSPALPTPRTPVWPKKNQGPDLPDGV